MALGGGDELGQVLTYLILCEAGPSSKIADVGGLCPGGDTGAKTSVVQIKDQIYESFHFIGTIDMRLQKSWIGRLS